MLDRLLVFRHTLYMATTHKTLKLWISRQADCVQHMVDAGDAEGAGYIARLLARDGYKLIGRTMNYEIPQKYQNRRLLKCGGCGQHSNRVVDGKDIGGMPGLYYNSCNGCGWNRAITFKTPKEKLRAKSNV